MLQDMLDSIGYISIHAPHARSDILIDYFVFLDIISIHAPHARSDLNSPCAVLGAAMSIHAPHARSDTGFHNENTWDRTFQSTLLMRGATRKGRIRPGIYYISIHAPHARSDNSVTATTFTGHLISIHAPHARSDEIAQQCICADRISIHAPHARSDSALG